MQVPELNPGSSNHIVADAQEELALDKDFAIEQ